MPRPSDLAIAALVATLSLAVSCATAPEDQSALANTPRRLPVEDWSMGFASDSPFESQYANSTSLFFSHSLDTWVDWSGGTSVHFQAREVNPSTGEKAWTWTLTLNLSYHVKTIAPGLGPHNFSLVGEARNGDTIIETISISPPDGAYYVEDWTQMPTIVSVMGSQGLLAPSDRPPLDRPTRLEVYRGSNLGADLLAASDPDGRYVSVLSRGLGVVHLFNVDPSVPAQSFTPLPSSAVHNVVSFAPYDSSIDGRKLVAHSVDSDLSVMFLSDYNNDALIDSVEILPKSTYQQIGFPSAWLRDFLNEDPILARIY